MKTNAQTSIVDQIEAQIDRSQWRAFQFSDLAKNINEKVSPQSSDLSHYIGLEHLDSGSVKIRRFGDPKAIQGDKLKIYKGDLIFAKRNAYLKRVSIAEFDAIASAHSMVLRAKPETVLPEFLPFFMLSDTFWDRAIAISVGSLSPTINWKALAKQEFIFPPKDQQAKLAKLLWAADAQVEAHRRTKGQHDVMMKSFVHDEILNSPDAAEMLLEDVVESMHGGKSLVCENKEYLPGTPGILKASAVTSGHFVSNEAKPVKEGDLSSLSVSVKADSILINRKNTRELVGVSCFVNEAHPNLFLSDLIWQIRTNKRALPKYLFYVLSSSRLRNSFAAISNGTSTSMVNIAKGNVAKIRVSIPPVEKQRIIVEKLNTFEAVSRSLDEAAANAKQLLKSLINQIF